MPNVNPIPRGYHTVTPFLNAAAVKDREGNIWWLATHVEDVSADELARRAKSNPQVA